MSRALALLVVAAFVVATVAVGVQTLRLRSARDALRVTRIDAANARASADTSRLELRREGDSLVAVARRLAFQREVDLRDAFRDTVRMVATAAAEIRIAAESLAVELAGEVARRDSAGAVRVSGTLDATDTAGVRVHVDVLVRPDLTSAWNWRLWRAALALELSLACAGDEAVAQVAGPPWASLELGRVEQVPEICIPPPPPPRWQPFALELPSLPVAAVLLVGGFLLGR